MNLGISFAPLVPDYVVWAALGDDFGWRPPEPVVSDELTSVAPSLLKSPATPDEML